MKSKCDEGTEGGWAGWHRDFDIPLISNRGPGGTLIQKARPRRPSVKWCVRDALGASNAPSTNAR